MAIAAGSNRLARSGDALEHWPSTAPAEFRSTKWLRHYRQRWLDEIKVKVRLGRLNTQADAEDRATGK